MKQFVSLLLAFFFITLVACNRDEDEPNKTVLLTAKPWKVDQVYVANQVITDPNLLQYLGQLQNTSIRFNADGTCTATDPNTQVVTSGTWQFNADQTRLLLDLPDQDFDFEIKVLSDNNLNLSTPVTVGPPTFPFPITQTVELRLIPA